MGILDIAEIELKKLNWLINWTEKKLDTYSDMPEDTLVCKCGSSMRYFYFSQTWANGKQTRKYLGDANNITVKRFKMRKFLRETMKALLNDRKLLVHLISHYSDYSPQAIHRKLPSSYKNLPDACYVDEQFEELKAWAAEKYDRNSYPLPTDPNIARDGTPFRSKGECMWYDNILFEDIPVRVEPVLNMRGESGQWHKLCPDFQFKCYDGSYLLVEHFGLWDDDKYAERNKTKIQEYLDCGFVLGDNLIVTSDNARHNTNELIIVEALDKVKKRTTGQ